ncbi:uncharacterized protein LOC131934686 [Physella acuta]|uniref:uncharacterized protein LOC131934686 n=1 Tax=Physella acuta TaxID=109671 RepID=UPI0027DB3080|nr:uncharacterized protein LOC131934686 [Physella acuta]XP_059146753.1 uncharacterized protein LOC131934686 [Physella acuta]XP_059146754.1 uncharacterized protein LOC131934686 [Physella acuta]XP_059146755.1 uncharacterized protein LOC131934686 [Physella acuta]
MNTGEDLNPSSFTTVSATYNTTTMNRTDEFGLTNTPLTAPESKLVLVDGSSNSSHNLASSHTEELAWLIPSVIGAVFVMVLLAVVFFYGVKAFEVRCLKCCYRTCGCCPARSSIGEETDALTSHMTSHSANEPTELKAFQFQRNSYTY